MLKEKAWNSTDNAKPNRNGQKASKVSHRGRPGTHQSASESRNYSRLLSGHQPFQGAEQKTEKLAGDVGRERCKRYI